MEPADRAPPSPGVRVLRGGEVLVSGDAVAWLASACQLAAAAHRSNGIGRPTRFDDLRHAFACAVQAAGGFATMAPASHSSAPGTAMADPITAGEAACLLGTSPQNVTQLCRRGSLATAHSIGGRWFLERAEIEARTRR